jgi:DNA polymerase sigma
LKSRRGEVGWARNNSSSAFECVLIVQGSDIPGVAQVIGKAKVPIIKFNDVETGLSFDISFDVANGPQAAGFVLNLMSTLPPMKPLVLILKMFLQQRELNEVMTAS